MKDYRRKEYLQEVWGLKGEIMQLYDKLRRPVAENNFSAAMHACMFPVDALIKKCWDSDGDILSLLMWPFHLITVIPGAIIGCPIGFLYTVSKYMYWMTTYRYYHKLFEQKNEQLKKLTGGKGMELTYDTTKGELSIIDNCLVF